MMLLSVFDQLTYAILKFGCKLLFQDEHLMHKVTQTAPEILTHKSEKPSRITLFFKY